MDKNEAKRALQMSKLILADTEFATVSKEKALKDIKESGVKTRTPVVDIEDSKAKARGYINIVENMFGDNSKKEADIKLKPLMVESNSSVNSNIEKRIGKIEESLSEIKLTLIEIKKNIL